MLRFALPIRANQRSDPLWAKPRSETPEPIAHDVADHPVCPESDTLTKPTKGAIGIVAYADFG